MQHKSPFLYGIKIPLNCGLPVLWLHRELFEGSNQVIDQQPIDRASVIISQHFLLLLLLLLLSRFSHVRLCATPWTAARQAPLSTGFSRQESWSGLPRLLHGLPPLPTRM